MRIDEDAEFRLTVTDSSIGLSGVFLAGGLLLFGMALLGHDPHARFGLSVAAGFLLLCAGLLVRTTRFVFHRDQRVLTWERRRMLARSTGRIPFDDIRAIVVETTGAADGMEGGTYRLALTTVSGSISFSDGYQSNLARYESMRNRIAAFVALRNAPLGETASAERDLHELVRQRRILDAVALIRAREHVDLTEARRRIAEIEKHLTSAGQ